jgi:predicted O-methyltransferase YrrM
MSSLTDRVRSKLETLAWFAARPELHRELLRRIASLEVRTARSVERDNEDKRRGVAWCRTVVADAREFVAQGFVAADAPALSARHASALDGAATRFAAAGGTMGGPAHLDVLYRMTSHLRPSVVVETGVAAGWSSLAILLALEENGADGRLWSADMPYPKRDNERFVGCAVPRDLRSRWTLVRRADRDALPEILARCGRVDLAHYDSDKSISGRMFGYQALWGALRDGGVLMSDDIEDNLAFRDFAVSVGRKPIVIGKEGDNFAGLLRK